MRFGLVLSVALIAIVVAASLWLVREQNQATQEAQSHAATADLLHTASERGAAGALYMQLAIITGDESLLVTSQDLLQESSTALQDAANTYREQGRPDDAADLEALLTGADELSKDWGNALILRQSGDTQAALETVSQTVTQMQSVGDILAVHSDDEQARIDAAKARADSVADFALYSLLALGVIGVLGAAAAGLTLSRSVLRPLATLQDAASRVTSGDLNARAASTGPTELRQLGDAFNDMTEALLDASKRRELESQREELVHDLHERVKELTGLQRVSRLLLDYDDIDEVVAGIAAIIPPAMQYPESSGAMVSISSDHQASINFAETPWVQRVSSSSHEGVWINITVCYHEEFPQEDDGPFLKEEVQLLTAIAEMLASYVDRRDATVRAEQSIERFSKAFHASPAPIAIVRARDGRLVDANAAFFEVLGWERADALSRPVMELNMWANEDERDRFQAAIASGAGTLSHGEYALRTKSGEIRHAYGSTERIDLDGEDCILSIFYDITARKQAEAALHDAEQRWNSLVNHSSDLVTLLDTSGVIIYESPSVREMLGYEQMELVGKNAFDLFHPDDAQSVIDIFAKLLDDPVARTVEFRYRHKDGSYRNIQAVGSALRDESGELKGVIAVSRDFTERRQMEERIAFQAHLLDASGEAVVATDMHGKVTYWNPAAEAMYGWTPEEALGSEIVSVISDVDTSQRDFALILEAVRNGTFNGEWTVRKKDGSIMPIESTMSPLTDDDGEVIGLIGVSHDITERKRAEETIRHMAYHDALTGLPNRLLLNDHFNLAMAHARRSAEKLCVLSLDLDRFKVVNDTLGHTTGDQLLKAAANRLLAFSRDGDTVARVGGDEFVLLLSGCQDPQEGTDVAERLIEAFREPFEISDVECHTTLSVGVSFYPDDGDTAEALMSAADAAMYAAKSSGRDGYRAFGPDIDTLAADWMVLETDLRRALTRGEIEVFYQPQVSVETGEIIGVEALARWRHPQHGMMPPGDFIKMSEETGLIVPLGEYVLARACSEAVAWGNAGASPVTLAVNVSLRQIERPDFVASVERILQTTGLPPQRLELEITETTALTNVDLTRAVAEKLAAMGIRLALDDFGTGNTALRYLSQLPVDTLKVDQSFVQNMMDDQRNAEIVASVIALGKALNLNVIAEGVETPKQLEFLKAHQCNAYQGFYFSQPEPAEITARMLGATEPEHSAIS